MRAPRVSGLLALLVVASCGDEVTAPPLSEPVTVESTTGATVAVPAPSPTGPAMSTSEPSTTAGDPVETQTTVSESSTTTTTTIARPMSGPVLLRGDGLGNARFGDPMSEVEPWLRNELGDPWWEGVARAPLAASQWHQAREMLRTLTFEIGAVSEQTGRATSLVVRFSDLSDARDDGVVHLAGWRTSRSGDEVLSTPAGLTIGTSLAELQELFPSLELGLDDPHGVQASFTITSASTGEEDIRGLLSSDDQVFQLEAGAETRTPDEIPDPPQTPDGPLVTDLVLRPDGLGGTDFGAAASDLVTMLTGRFGQPAEEMNVHAPPGDTLYYRVPLGYFPDAELRYLTWHDPGLTIVVSDGEGYGSLAPGDVRLIFWATSSNRLRLADGLGVDSTLAELEATYTDVSVGIRNECASAFYPSSFRANTDVGAMEGSVLWDWVSDVQQALNQRGASLAVDGEYGPLTTAAVRVFQTEAEINSTASWDSNGEVGPLTLEALGLTAPRTAPIERLRAGNEGSC